MATDERAFWLVEPGRGEIRPVRVPEPGAAADAQTGELPTRKRLTVRRLDTIFRVNAQSSYMAARYREMMADVDNRPWFEYVAVMDGKTRPAHRALHGRVFRYDDKAVSVFWPPCGWRCRCRMRARDDADLRERGITPEDTAGRIKTETVTLVYPAEADIARRRISVMTPIGTALIGLALGDSITWETRNGDRRLLTVLQVREPPPA